MCYKPIEIRIFTLAETLTWGFFYWKNWENRGLTLFGFAVYVETSGNAYLIRVFSAGGGTLE